jgi:hypothetical protein
MRRPFRTRSFIPLLSRDCVPSFYESSLWDRFYPSFPRNWIGSILPKASPITAASSQGRSTSVHPDSCASRSCSTLFHNASSSPQAVRKKAARSSRASSIARMNTSSSCDGGFIPINAHFLARKAHPYVGRNGIPSSSLAAMPKLTEYHFGRFALPSAPYLRFAPIVLHPRPSSLPRSGPFTPPAPLPPRAATPRPSPRDASRCRGRDHSRRIAPRASLPPDGKATAPHHRARPWPVPWLR